MVRILTPGDYGALVSPSVLREALNLRPDKPTDAALRLRIGEASQRIEGLTRMALPTSTWEYTFWVLPEFLEIPGLFPVGESATATASDHDGAAVPVAVSVQGRGEAVRVSPVSGSWAGVTLPLTLQLVRGVNADNLPADLRAAVITQAEALIEGFNMAGENAILRVCSRYGWTGCQVV